MLHAVSLKISPRNKCNFRIVDRHGGSWKRATIKDRQFCDRLPRNIHRQYLLSTVRGGFEDPNLALRDDMQAVARLSFRDCLLYTSPSPRDGLLPRMPSSA